MIENPPAELSTTVPLKRDGFWLVIIILLLAVTQGVRMIILQTNSPTFLNNKFAFSLNIPVAISYGLYAIVFFFIARYLWQHWRKLQVTMRLGLSLILCGGLSNLLERLWFGYVVDYIFIANGVLNLADCYIITGVVLIFATRGHRQS